MATINIFQEIDRLHSEWEKLDKSAKLGWLTGEKMRLNRLANQFAQYISVRGGFVNADLLNKMSEFVADGEVVSAMNARLKAARLKVQDREQYAVHIAPTASGPFVMTSTTMVAELKKAERKLSAVDMEGYALYCTGHVFNKPALWIKGVLDMMDANKDDRYHQTAFYASACLLLLFIKDKLYC